MAEQLTFDLPKRAALGRDDFFVSPSNALALAALDDWRAWPLGKMVLVGPHGAGKTHLAHVWAASAEATIVGAGDLAKADLPALAAAGAVAVEDADTDALDPAALFHLHILLAEAKGALLVTATCPPAQWATALPDLVSRMQAAALSRLDPPDDALLQAVLVKQFNDRQLAVTPEVTHYLLQRMDRSFDATQRLVEALDATALPKGRRITRGFAGAVLDKLQGPDA